MLEQSFLNFGYTKDEYEKIRNTFPVINLRDETLLNNFENITKFLLNNDYTKADIIKMTKTLPQLFGHSIDNIKQKIDDIVNLGYTREDVIKMTKTLPSLFNLSIENIKQKIDDIISLGYTREEVIKMSSKFPPLFGLSIENIKQKIDDIISLGYTREEVIKMTKTLPALFGLSIENIKQKINFYDSIDMHDLSVVNPKYLMQSTKLSYARYEFYKVKGIKIDMTNYRKLFLGSKRFEKQYGITKEELLEKYKYEDYIKTESKAK